MKITLQVAALSALTAVASAQVPAGGEFQINTYTTGSQATSLGGAIDMDAAGNAVIVWNGNGPASTRPITARRFDAAGTLEPELDVFTPVPPTSTNGSSVAVDRRGDFVVAWHGAPNTAEDIYARRYDRTGNALGPPFQVNTYTDFIQAFPRVATDSARNFVVVWMDSSGEGSGQGAFGRLYDPSGQPRGGQFLINTYTTDDQSLPSVAYDGRGDFVVVWVSWRQDGSYGGIFGQRYLASGTRVGNEFAVNSSTLGTQSSPHVSADRAGNFVVVWHDEAGLDGDGYGVVGRLYDASGAPRGPEFQINQHTTDNQQLVTADFDDTGNFVVVWTSRGQDGDGDGVFGQRYDAAGLRRGAEFRVNAYTTHYQFGPTVASDAVGNFSVVWTSADQDGHLLGVYAQRFGGIVPQALRVDTSGNGVLEPGETVDAQPSWRNVNGTAQTFSGALSDITGPAGATYAITDGGGDYGAVADGATAPCTDCYAVSVSNPATRPATHWDAAAVESILPEIQGQQKQWLLHVGRSFTDVPESNGFYRFIETLLHHNVTSGCGATAYCPASSTTREQMAVFVIVAKEGAGYVPTACGATPMFADVPAGNPFCRWIEELARRAVVSGCGGGNYCPTSAVTREEMAVFVLRTLDPALTPPACVTPVYSDVPATSGFCPWIEELTRRSVVTGCGGGNYCPTAPVTREQMGVFISATFGLTLYGP